MSEALTKANQAELFDRMKALSIEDMSVAIQAFPIEVVFNELERRELERISLIKQLDEISKSLSSITR